MRKIFAFALAAFVILMLAGCAAPQQSEEASESRPSGQSADAGREIEQFGFVFTIPQGVTSNGIDDGIYDIDFGEIGQREAFIGINPPEDLTGKGNDETDLLQLCMEDMRQGTQGYFENITNDVMEIRELDGNPAGYIGMDCTIHGVPVYWQIYMAILDDTLYSFTIQVYTDAITEDTMAAIEQFITEMQIAGA
ncbi:MAG: hypothetical protein ACOYJB_02605 [Christensenellaceae bacterium]